MSTVRHSPGAAIYSSDKTKKLILDPAGSSGTATTVSTSQSADVTFTLPDTGGVNANILVSQGAQTVNGVKTFSSAPNLSGLTANGLLGLDGSKNVTSTALTNGQLLIGSTGGTPVAATLTGTVNQITVTNGAGTITLSLAQSIASGSSPTFASVTLTNTTNQLTMGTTNTVTISSVAPASSRTYTLPDTGANSSFVMTDAAQTVNGVKTFSSAPNLSSLTANGLLGLDGSKNVTSTALTNGQLLIGSTSSTPVAAALTGTVNQVTVTNGAGTITLSLPQSIATSSSPTFASATLTNTTNQLVLGTTNTVTITSTAPASSRTYTLPDTGANSSFVMTDGTQTINGAKTFSGTHNFSNLTANGLLGLDGSKNVTSTALTNGQLLIGSTSSTPVAAALTGTTNQVTVTNGAGTITLSLPQSIATSSSPTFASATFTNTTNQLVLGTTNTVTITSTAPASSRTYTLPDAGTNSSFVMTDSAQTVNGVKTFSSAPNLSSLTANGLLGLDGSKNVTSTALTNGQLLIGSTSSTPVAATITGTTNQVTVTNGAGTITLSLPQSIATSSSPTFASATLTSTTNQLVLGTTNTVTITSTAPASSRTYTIPDAGTNSNFVMTDSAQTINGAKTFSSALLGTFADSNSVSRLGIGTDVLFTTGVADDKKILLDVRGAATYAYRAIGSETEYMSFHNGSTSSSSGYKFYVSNLAQNSRNIAFQINSAGNEAAGTITAQTGYGFKVNDTNATDATTTTSGALQVVGGAGITKSLFVGSNLTVGGNLTINGTTTTVNTQTITVSDNFIVVNAGPTGVKDGGALVQRYQTANDTALGDVITDTAALTGTVQASGSTTTVTLDSSASAIDSIYNNYWILITAGTGVNQARQILSYVGATKVATLVTAWTTQPVLGSSYSLFGNNYTGIYYASNLKRHVIAFTAQENVTTVSVQKYAGMDVANANIKDTTNQVVLGTGTTITITAPVPASSRTYTIPDSGANSNFVMSDGAQTVNGVKTFSSAPNLSSLTANGLLGLDGSKNVTSTALTNGQLLIGSTSSTPVAATITGTTNQVTVTNGAGTITLSLPQSIATSSSPTFASATLTSTTNQLVLGTTNTVTITSTAPASSRTYTLPDTGANSSFVMTDGAQTIGGTKTFSTSIRFSTSTTILSIDTPSGGNYTINVQDTNSVSTVTIPFAILGGSFLGTSGAQTITGVKTFSSDFIYSNGADHTLTVTRASSGAGNALNIASGSATSGAADTSGGDLTLSGGLSTGTGHSRVRLQSYATSAATDTHDNAQVDRLVINSAKSVTNNSATTLLTHTVASGTATGGQLVYTITVTNGTDFQSYSASINYVIVNKAGAITYQIAETSPAKITTSGTLAVSWSMSTGAGTCALQLNANSSLTPSTGYPRVTYTLNNNGDQAVALS